MPEIPTQPQPTSNQKSINWKKIITVIVIGAVVIGLGVLLFLILQPKEDTATPVTTKKATPSAKTSTPSAKKDETENWNVYTNTKYNYSIKYPSGWLVDDKGRFIPQSNCQTKVGGELGEGSKQVFIHNDQTLECVTVSTHGYLLFSITFSDSPVDFNMYKEGSTKAESWCGSSTTKFTSFVGVKAVKITRSSSYCQGYVVNSSISFNYKNGSFRIEIPVDKNGRQDPAYDKMLSTFKFLD